MNVAQLIKASLKFPFKFAASKFGYHNRKHNEPQLLVLMYHRILPTDDLRAKAEEPGMMVTPDSFEMHLTTLSETFEFTQLSDWISKKEQNLPLPALSCAITFDDGWADNYQYAFPLLKKHNIPATIFVVSDMMDTREIFWPEQLIQICHTIASHSAETWKHADLNWITSAPTSYAFDASLPTSDQIAEIINHIKQYSDSEIIQKLQQIISVHCPDIIADERALLNWQEINELIESGLIEIGSHTCNHSRLNDFLDDAEISHQVTQSKQSITEKTGQNITSFCFPNGDFNEQALLAVKSQYQCSVTTQTGWNNLHSDPYLLNRVGIHNDIAKSRINFLACLSGWSI